LKKEANELKLKLKAAQTYYEHQLMIKYGIVPFANLLVQRQKKQNLALF